MEINKVSWGKAGKSRHSPLLVIKPNLAAQKKDGQSGRPQEVLNVSASAAHDFATIGLCIVDSALCAGHFGLFVPPLAGRKAGRCRGKRQSGCGQKHLDGHQSFSCFG
jgi:hypothetical protein